MRMDIVAQIRLANYGLRIVGNIVVAKDSLYHGHKQMQQHHDQEPDDKPRKPKAMGVKPGDMSKEEYSNRYGNPKPKADSHPTESKKPTEEPEYNDEGEVIKGWQAYDVNHQVKPLSVEKGRPAARWHAADIGEETEELERTSSSNTDEGGLNLNHDKLMRAVRNAQVAPLEDHHWKDLDNTDSWETTTHKKVHEMGKKYDRDINSIVDGFNKGTSMPTPIVLHRKGKNPYLVGGNSRLMAARSMGIKPHVMHVNYD